MSSNLLPRGKSSEDLEQANDDTIRSTFSPSAMSLLPDAKVNLASLSSLKSPRLKGPLRLAILGCILLLVLTGARMSDRLGGNSLSIEFPYHSKLGSTSPLNRTLDFEKVFVISLPDRYKKRDILTMMAYTQDLLFEFQDGVSLEATLSDKDKQDLFPINDTSMQVNKLASFRSHANVWQKMLVDDISTALILEDDADWDVTMRSQLKKVQTNLRDLLFQMAPEGSKSFKSGEWPSAGWDILRLGFCLEKSYSKGQYHGLPIDQVPSRIYSDDNVPKEGECIAQQEVIMKEFQLYRSALSSASSSAAEEDISGKRVLVPSISPVCLQAYAVTREGAAKLLYYQNRVRLNIANDLGVAAATESGFLKSYSIVPTLFSQFKSFGDTKNSDIITGSSSVTAGTETLFDGGHFCIVNSTRMSLTARYPHPW